MLSYDHDIVLECRNVSHSFGEDHVLYDVNLKMIRGEIVALVGPSGAGKSTLLQAILGTHPPQKGQVVVTNWRGEQYVVNKPGRDRGIVYQNYSLFPFLTAQENVALGLMFDQSSLRSRLFHRRKWGKMRKQHLEIAAERLSKLGLADHMAKYPDQLSGGQQQRTAIGQALVMEPEILLLDEPFGALDEATREDLQHVLLGLYEENCRRKERNERPASTILIVTHELNEAIYVGDRVVALSKYWNWRDSDYGFTKCPGATIVYDELAPVNLPDQERDFATFARQRADIRRAAFSEENLHKREDYCHFWQDVTRGVGTGILGQEVRCENSAVCMLNVVCELAQEIRRITKSRETAEQISLKLGRAVRQKIGRIDGVFQLWMDSSGERERIRKDAHRDCFWLPVKKSLARLARHAPSARQELVDHLAPIMDIIERGDAPRHIPDDDGAAPGAQDPHAEQDISR
ncbi:MAG: hypothetical protein A2Y77_10045 [Planctomycetes bacterium RBG_13_62_9]|nr:MAG: hypothetical protein A2Y77_10045 [Planctomycetes bacterium RBG_13_62_9]